MTSSRYEVRGTFAKWNHFLRSSGGSTLLGVYCIYNVKIYFIHLRKFVEDLNKHSTY